MASKDGRGPSIWDPFIQVPDERNGKPTMILSENGMDQPGNMT
ncbi:hypothetical protein Patl1_33591 [Pistacia atlantica]|uniref:Uncharacterized protein n=1 Tax=Pistacia atlantica TaxID=434234 RepID=A0ACC0ZRY8_9ROSI|nr:hypothetical protein Patl1_33591 [Pistacia atlantica]